MSFMRRHSRFEYRARRLGAEGGRLISVAIAASFGLIFPSLCKIDTYEELTPTEPSQAPV